jgi:hypothetical protein
MDKSAEHQIEFFEAGEDSAKAFEPTEQSFDFIAATIQDTIVFPGVDPVVLGRDDGGITQIDRPLPSFISFVGTIHQEMNGLFHRPHLFKQRAPFRRIMGLSGRQRKRYRRSVIRGNPMNLGSPSFTGFPDGLSSVSLMPRSHRDEP